MARAREISDLIVIVHERNRGYGGNQKTCYREALRRGAEVVIMIHPDFQYDPRHVPRLLVPILRGEADMVLGSRFLAGDPRRGGMHWWRYLGNRFLTTLQNLVLGTAFSECHSGYRAYHRRVLAAIPYQTFADGFLFDSQLLAVVAGAGFRIREVPIPTRYTAESSSIPFLAAVRYGLETLGTLGPALAARILRRRLSPLQLRRTDPSRCRCRWRALFVLPLPGAGRRSFSATTR